MMRTYTNDVERHRVRRTLTEVKNKLEEALRLSEQLQSKGNHGEPTTPDYRR
jgi:RNase P protein component